MTQNPTSTKSAICNLQPAIRKTRPDDVLGNLPKADRDRILDMLDHRSYRDVLQEINQPVPEGLGLKIQYNSLRKFYLKHLPIRVAEERPEIAGDWKLLAEAAARDPIDLQNVIRESLEREVYLAFQYSEPTNPRPMKLLDRLLRWRGQDIAKARLDAKSGKSNPASFFLPDFLNSIPASAGQPNLANPFSGIPPVPAAAAPTAAADPTTMAKLQSMTATAEAQANQSTAPMSTLKTASALTPQPEPLSPLSGMPGVLTAPPANLHPNHGTANPELAPAQAGPCATPAVDQPVPGAAPSTPKVGPTENALRAQTGEQCRTTLNNVEQHKTTLNNLTFSSADPIPETTAA